MKEISFTSPLNIVTELLKKLSSFNLGSGNEKHMFSFLDKDNPYEISSLHWDEYGNPFIYYGESRNNNSCRR